MIDRPGPPAAIMGFSDVAARGLAVACALNLNGVASMVFDLGQVASVLMLVASLFLILKRGHAAWSMPLVLLLLAILSYLLLASIFYDPFEAVYDPEKYYQAYGAAVLILWAIAGYTASLEPGQRLNSFLRFLRNIFLVSAASVWASPILYEYYVNLPFSARDRMGGFFANPNEAAMASLIAAALTLSIPFRSRLLQVPFLALTAGAVLLTFSKTAISCLVIIFAWHLFHRLKAGILFLLPILAILTVAAIENADDFFQMVIENPWVELSPSQKDRIVAVGKILSGEIDEKTSTGRTQLWGLVIEKAWDRFPLGSGIGSAHNVVGGVLEYDVWQGAHNSIIMMLGESGPLPAALLVASIITLLMASLRNPLWLIALPCVFVLAIDMMATHGTLSTRYHNLMLAVVLGLVANRALALSSARPVARGGLRPHVLSRVLSPGLQPGYPSRPDGMLAENAPAGPVLGIARPNFEQRRSGR